MQAAEPGVVIYAFNLRAQRLKVCITLAEDPSLVPSTHIRRLTLAVHTSVRGSHASGLCGRCTHVHITTHRRVDDGGDGDETFGV